MLRMSYQGQNLSGARGEVVQTFSDFREVDGMTVPFITQSTFEGEPFVATTTETITFNETLADDLFQRPEAVTAQRDGD